MNQTLAGPAYSTHDWLPLLLTVLIQYFISCSLPGKHADLFSSFPICCCFLSATLCCQSDSSCGRADGPGVRWSANKHRDTAAFTAEGVGLFPGETTAHKLLHQLRRLFVNFTKRNCRQPLKTVRK